MNASQIQKLRHALGENTEAFGERFARSSRTVEQWEQGRRTPDPLVLKLLQELWDAQFGKPTAKKASRKKS